jgi:hypothetical protein
MASTGGSDSPSRRAPPPGVTPISPPRGAAGATRRAPASPLPTTMTPFSITGMTRDEAELAAFMAPGGRHRIGPSGVPLKFSAAAAAVKGTATPGASTLRAGGTAAAPLGSTAAVTPSAFSATATPAGTTP